LDAARAELAELRAERDRLLDAWAKDEAITADGSLRPTIAATIKRAEEIEAERDVYWSEMKRYQDELYHALDEITALKAEVDAFKAIGVALDRKNGSLKAKVEKYKSFWDAHNKPVEIPLSELSTTNIYNLKYVQCPKCNGFRAEGSTCDLINRIE